MDELSLKEMIEKYKKELVEFSNAIKNKAADILQEDVLPVSEKKTEKDVDEDANFNEEYENVTTADYLKEPYVTSGARAAQGMMTPEDPNREITELEGTNSSGFNAGRKEQKYDTYEEFLSDNPETGTLRIQGYIASQAFPATEASVEIRKELKNGSYLIYSGETDESGVYGPVRLPAPEKEYSEEFSDKIPYANYLVTVKKEGFVTMIYKNLPIFPGVESNQNVNFIPLNQVGENMSSIVIDALEPIDL